MIGKLSKKRNLTQMLKTFMLTPPDTAKVKLFSADWKSSLPSKLIEFMLKTLNVLLINQLICLSFISLYVSTLYNFYLLKFHFLIASFVIYWE